MIGPESGAIQVGMRRSAQLHGVVLEELDAHQCATRFPTFKLPPGMRALFEPGAGFLHVEAAVRQMSRLAEKRGATLFCDERVLSWQSQSNHIEVITTRRTIQTGRLVLTAGPWINSLLGAQRLPLTLHKMMMMWFAPATVDCRTLPGFGYDLPGGFFYGLPQVSEFGVKIGKHVAECPLDDADALDRGLSELHAGPLREFARDYLPFVSDRVTRHAACLYTMTPDEDFIIDVLPSDPRVVFASSCSGHGFKFAPVVGEILCDLAVDGKTQQPAEFLRLKRLSRA